GGGGGVSRRWEGGKGGAGADEMGADGEHDVNRNIALAACFKQQLYECRGGVVTTRLIGRVGKTEKLLELIDNDEYLIALRQAGETNHLDEAEAAAAEGHFEQHGAFSGRIHPRRGLAQDRGIIERGGQISDRIAAGPKNRDTPMGAAIGQKPPV